MEQNRVTDDLLVVRGTDLERIGGDLDDPSTLIGHTFTEPSFTSTSLAPVPPAGFSAKPVLLYWRVPAGAPAIWLEQVAVRGTDELDLLLGRNVRYTVDRVVHEGGKWHIYGRVQL